MTTPIIESIAENIKDAINLITTGNGFNQTLVAQRPKRSDFLNTAWDDLTVLVNQVDAEKPEGAIFATTWRQYFNITAIVIDSDDATASIDTRLNQVSADIEKKLMADGTRGGNAIDTAIIVKIPFFDDETAVTGIAVQVAVDYRTEIEDPYTKA